MGTYTTRITCFISLICSIIIFVKADLYVSTDSTTVSEGTGTSFTCYSDVLADQNIFSTGGKVVWCRYPRYSSSLQQVAQWTFANNAEILLTDPQDEQRFEIEGGLTSHTIVNLNLVIRQTSKYDQGTYSCILYNGSGQMISKSEDLPLTVKYPPADYFPFCTASPADVGTDVNLLCQSENTTPAVSVQWYKDNVKVADGYPYDRRTTSEYTARQVELGSQFECRLVYDDDSGIRVERSCRFSRPFVAMLRKMGEVNSEETMYHAFAHSNPPFVDDIDCSLESSTGTRIDFETEFPGYGLATIGAVAPADNGTDLVCQATNVFGSAYARMPIYTNANRNGETTSPSVVTNYMPNQGSLNASIWPKHPLVQVGDNVTFVCSYSLEIHSSSRARVAITWRYNDILVIETVSRFTVAENSLQVKGIASVDDGVIVTCVASLIVDDTPVVNIPSGQSTTQIRVRTGSDNCLIPGNGNTAYQSQTGNSSIFYSSSFLVGVSVLAGVGWILCVIFILMIVARNRKEHRLGMANIRRMSSQMTYRAGTNTMNNGLHGGSISTTNPTMRALPEQPSHNQIRIEPANGPTASLQIGVPIEPSKPELAYQEMVGNTGVMGSRNGDSMRANGGVNGVANGGMSNGAPCQPVLVPAPNGGFIPPEMLASNAPSREKSGAQEGAELNYEDLDCMRHHDQQHTRRATGNDYQTSISNTPYLRHQEEQDLLPHYANS